MALDVTVGGASSNSYATLLEADAYNASRLFSTDWVVSGASNEPAMLWACRLLDASFQWTGTAVDAVQALAWPRNGMLTLNGYAIGTTTIPVQLKDAQCEFARQLIAADRSADSDAEKQGISSVKAGSVSVSFEDVSGANKSSLAMMDAALRKMGPDFTYVSRTVPDAVRGLLVPSWYERKSLLRPLIFDVAR